MKVIHDQVLGALDAQDDECLFGDLDFKEGQRISISIDFFPEEDALEEVLSRARQVLALVKKREMEYRQWTADRLVDRRWNREEPMTAEDITGLLLLASLDIRRDGQVWLYWNDHDVLFAGHNVVTELNADGECVQAGMQ
jgi:hypothetical protein